MTSIQMDKKKFQKMLFINNAIEEGWSVKKNEESDSYIFTKKHENKREIFQSDYLEKFIQKNALDMTILTTVPTNI
uniref:Uncharacterized protein n=1 Tax=viral metagenome TaxID=1070528 RepID=A0A6C0HYR3_9ZZZZ